MASTLHANDINIVEEEYYFDHQPDMPRTPRRTQMACQFCRGRKLKCDGNKPSCGNCDKRNFACLYQPVNPQRS